jgi:C-terminal processing protease CtpA/Prc
VVVRTSGALLAVALAAASCADRTGSIGAVLARDHATRAVRVREVPAGLGASDADLRPGDEIVMIAGRYARDLDDRELRGALRGDVGSAVDLVIVRGDEVRRVRVKRTALRAPAPPAPSR